jgi:hypothetical protein
MRVDAGRGGESGRSARERGCALTAGQRLADHEDVRDPRASGAGEDGVAIGVERGIAEMTVRVD